MNCDRPRDGDHPRDDDHLIDHINPPDNNPHLSNTKSKKRQKIIFMKLKHLFNQSMFN